MVGQVAGHGGKAKDKKTSIKTRGDSIGRGEAKSTNKANRTTLAERDVGANLASRHAW
jgi:hypothetical protein